MKATSCTAEQPFSRMWYPEIEIVFHFGTFSWQYSKMSVVSRIVGSGG